MDRGPSHLQRGGRESPREEAGAEARPLGRNEVAAFGWAWPSVADGEGRRTGEVGAARGKITQDLVSLV